MTGRVLALPIGAALLLAAGVYLFVQVHATPATPEIAKRAAEPTHPEPAAEVAHGETPAAPAETPDDEPRRGHGKHRPDAEDRAAVAGRTPLADEPEAKGVTPGIAAKLEGVMQQANRAYDRGDLDEAKLLAGRVLTAQPDNVRMLRILVSSSCIDGDSSTATTNFAKLPPGDQEQMRTRCARYGINL